MIDIYIFRKKIKNQHCDPRESCHAANQENRNSAQEDFPYTLLYGLLKKSSRKNRRIFS